MTLQLKNSSIPAQGKRATWHICWTLFLPWGPIRKAAVCLNKAGADLGAARAQVVVLADALDRPQVQDL